MKFGPYGKTLIMKATNSAGIYMRFQSIPDANIIIYPEVSVNNTAQITP